MKHKSSRGPYLSCNGSQLCVVLESLEIPLLPPPLKRCSNIYPCFVSGSVQFFLLTPLFFISLLISSLWHGQWWGILQLYCSTRWEQALRLYRWGALASRCCMREGGCQLRAREWLTPLRHSPWLWLVVLILERWILTNQITATGWSHRQLTCMLFYCQIIMPIWANITKK